MSQESELDRVHRAVKELVAPEAEGPSTLRTLSMRCLWWARQSGWVVEPLISYFRKVEMEIATGAPVSSAKH
jgi:hypothetical protein